MTPSLSEMRKIAEAVILVDRPGPRRLEALAKFQDTLTPSTVLALLDRLEAAERVVEAFRKVAAMCHDQESDDFYRTCDALDAFDALARGK